MINLIVKCVLFKKVVYVCVNKQITLLQMLFLLKKQGFIQRDPNQVCVYVEEENQLITKNKSISQLNLSNNLTLKLY